MSDAPEQRSSSDVDDCSIADHRPAPRAGSGRAAAPSRAGDRHPCRPMGSHPPHPVLRRLRAALHVHPGSSWSCSSRSTTPTGKFNYVWNEFSLKAWTNVWSDTEITDSLTLSIEIALVSTLVATLLGTLIAFAIGRHHFRGRAGTNLLIFMPMATPEVVMGSSLLTLFVDGGAGGEPRVPDHHSRPHHVQHQLRGGHREGAHRRS